MLLETPRKADSCQQFRDLCELPQIERELGLMRASRENRAEKRCQPNQVQLSNASGRNEKQNAGMQEQAPLVSNPKRSKRNPLRGHLNALSVAIVEANKLDHYIDDDALEWIRKGEAAARTLAEELARIATRISPRTIASEFDHPKHDAMGQMVGQALEEEPK
jgi:hypothetical protein